jgi:hypothetical protein
MFKSKKSIGKAISHTAAALVLGGIALTSMAEPAQAQSTGVNGKIYAVAECKLATNRGDVGVTVMNPDKFKSSGLVYFVQLWVKPSSAATWTKIAEGQTGVIKTHKATSIAGVTMNDPTRIFNGWFTGTDGAFDLYIQYWFKTPTATTWSSTYGFNVGSDPDSVIYTISNNGYGPLYSQTSRCNL